MSSLAASAAPSPDALMAELLPACADALGAVDHYVAAARDALARVTGDGKGDAFERHQYATHGFAWAATYAAALRELLAWARRLEEANTLSETEALILQIGFGEYLAQLRGGIPLSQGEIVRASDLGLDGSALAPLHAGAIETLIARGTAHGARMRLATLVADGNFGDDGLADETLVMVRDQFRRFADEQVVPHAHGWHVRDELIPLEILEKMGELGVFGLTVPQELGGLGLGKIAMCVVTEELARAYIGVGSLGTRSEIAAELLVASGTPDQRARWLPGIVSGATIPTAVFTEPNTGSDLASLRTRAERAGDAYRVTGNKTWITHAARADLMTLLVRTDPKEAGYKGLSMFLAAKPRGMVDNPFPAKGMSGGEIRVLGYRGMKEYDIAFDGFSVPARDLLGGVEGQGFKQLMATFESARVQTAARAVGVARNAMELALDYARTRVQFGRPIAGFPRVAGKIAWMAVETMIARQLTHFAAREKDSGRRCDIEAGMAKLLAARVAWANADNAVQVHGGNGYAVEFPISRVLCDARILNIFEGTAEIQATVIARGLLARRN
ncbi:MAG: acyl-CoA dehydrogenase family protein [Alphaproteobacteria bacterium]